MLTFVMQRSRQSASNFGMTFQYTYIALSLTFFILLDHFFDRIVNGPAEDDDHYGMVAFFLRRCLL
jgi:hypothetical protein